MANRIVVMQVSNEEVAAIVQRGLQVLLIQNLDCTFHHLTEYRSICIMDLVFVLRLFAGLG